MGQGEVLELLETTQKKLSCVEIATILEKSQSATSTVLKKLIHQKNIQTGYIERPMGIHVRGSPFKKVYYV